MPFGEGDDLFWHNETLGVSLWKNPSNTTNIFEASLEGNVFFLQVYLEVGGDLGVSDPKGVSALHYACAGGALNTLDFLIKSSDSDVIDYQDHDGCSPLFYACR